MPRQFDIGVIGAGPAGLCAALRLQQLGYRILLIERSTTWPRSQIGEALTSGVRNIIDFLDANEALQHVPLLARMPTRLRWRSKTPETIDHADAAIVDRAAFDAALLQLAVARGIEVHQPARLSAISGGAGAWQLAIETSSTTFEANVGMILDAQGRQHHASEHVLYAPRLSALWVDLAQEQVPAEWTTQVEALEQGWLWGARLPNRCYRIMLLSDPALMKHSSGGQPVSLLHRHCAASELFTAATPQLSGSIVQMCSASPYVAKNCWQDGRMKIGDAAFAIDPISSSGVEKAMRFSLQAAIAVHTSLQTDSAGQQTLAAQFYRQRLIEVYARHHFWTASYYRQAWCHEQPFWQQRSILLPKSASEHDEAAAMMEALTREVGQLSNYREREWIAEPALQAHQTIRFDSRLEITSQLCVVDDKVEVLPAMRHPHLERPLAFWENEALLPRLGALSNNTRLSSLLDFLGTTMGQQKARRLLDWLWKLGLVEVVHPL